MESCPGKETLRRHRTMLVQDMNITQLKQILDAIYSKKIISQEEHDLVKSCPLSQDCARHLLDIINSKGEDACCRFLKRLKKVNKPLWRRVAGRTASRQRCRKRESDCDVQIRPDPDRSIPEVSQPCGDDGGTWKCQVLEDTQGTIRLRLNRHAQCLSSEDSSSQQGQESPGMDSDSSPSCFSSSSTEHSHSNKTRNFESSRSAEDVVPRKKLPPDEAPSCSYAEGGRIHEPKLEMYQPPLTPVETPPLLYTAVCDSHQDRECACHVQGPLYPTPEDAWAWLHYVDDFFQKDSTAAMAIRTAWSANELAKHIIKDRFYYPYLCRYWQKFKVFPSYFSDFMDFLVSTSATDFCVKNGVNLPEVSFKSKCLHLGEIAFAHQTAYGSRCQLAAEEDLPAFSFGWLQKCNNSPTARSPGNGQPCMYVHDSIRQYLMACWIAHVIGNPSLHFKMSEGLSSFYEVASSCPVTCYCLANFLGKSEEPKEKVFSMVGPLLQAWIEPMKDFQRFLLTTIIVESKQCSLLTGVLSCLFPNSLVDLSSLPDLSYHNLHSIQTVIEETDIIQSIKLPGNLSLDTMMDPYPFNSDEPVDINTDRCRCIPYVSLIQCLRIKEIKENPTCSFADINIVYIRCNGDNPMAVRHIVQFLPELKTLELRPQTKFDQRAFSYIAPALVFTPHLSSVLFGNNKRNLDLGVLN